MMVKRKRGLAESYHPKEHILHYLALLAKVRVFLYYSSVIT